MLNIAGYVATGIVSVIVGLLLRHLEPKSKVVGWSPHRFLFNLVDPPIILFTHAHTVQNIGRKAAEDIEIFHRSRPDFFKLEPALNYEEYITPAGEHVVKIPNLGPKEFFTIEFLTYKAAYLPELLYIRTKDGQSEFIAIQPQRIFPRWFRYLVALFIWIGIGFSVYWLISAIDVSKGIGIA